MPHSKLSKHDRRQPENVRNPLIVCGHCAFWEPMKANEVKGEKALGWCRRYAPTPQMIEKSTEVSVVYPVRLAVQFCGEFQPIKTIGMEQREKQMQAEQEAFEAAQKGIVLAQQAPPAEILIGK